MSWPNDEKYNDNQRNIMALICETKWAADKATYICNVVGGSINDVDMSLSKYEI